MAVIQGAEVQGVSCRVIWPSSLLPLTLWLAACLGGQVNGRRSSSRPPPSRAASTTTRYSPAGSCLKGASALLKLRLCLPTALVAPLTPSTGISRLRPLRRHHWRRSLSHFSPSLSLSFWSYHTARLATCFWSGCSSQMAT